MKQFIKSLRIRFFIFILSVGIIICLVFAQDSFQLSKLRNSDPDQKGFVVGDYVVVFKTEQFTERLVGFVSDPFNVRIGYSDSKRPLSVYLISPTKRTLYLLVPAFFFSVIVGILLGILGARLKNRFLKNLHLTITIGLMSFPDIFLILMVQLGIVWLYKHDIKWFRVVGYGDFKSLVIPFLVLVLIPTQYISRITTVAVERQQDKKFVMIARSKGLSSVRVFLVHIMKNAFTEILGAFSSLFIILISCQLLVEYMFAYPGIIYTMFSSSTQSAVVIGTGVILVLFYFAVTLMIDVILYLLSPYKKEQIINEPVMELAPSINKEYQKEDKL